MQSTFSAETNNPSPTVSPILEFYERELLPVLFDRLDQAFPEFQWSRTAEGWSGLANQSIGSTLTRAVWCKQPWGFVDASGHAMGWLEYLNGGSLPANDALVTTIQKLARRAGVDDSALDRGYLSDEEQSEVGGDMDLLKFENQISVFDNFLKLFIHYICSRCFQLEKYIHHNGSINNVLSPKREISKTYYENYFDDHEHGFFHGLSCCYIIYLLHGKYHSDFPDIKLEKTFASALIHDFLKCNGFPQETHDRELISFFPNLLPETYVHGNPPSEFSSWRSKRALRPTVGCNQPLRRPSSSGSGLPKSGSACDQVRQRPVLRSATRRRQGLRQI